MSDPWDGPGRQATRNRSARVPGARATEAEGRRRRGGRTAARAGGRSRDARRGRPGRRTGRVRRVLKALAIGTSLLILVTAGAGWWFYEHLNGNIHSLSLDGKGGTEKADAFGRTPINILVMGSDGRTSAEDCKLGGGCSQTGVQSGNGNADVEMVLHISADRSNATVMSIPRDTMTKVPACQDPGSGQSTPGYYGQINSALTYGPACQVATIHQLTGIPIDHFVKLDFSGVVKMSDAIGGVSV
ncbi:LCP family protein, partial [Streptomyces monashensis]|uniref:LCP family protein n=1 Tax=Streptomyces monashensis TaxID=1678012 RepID=UPI003F54067C